MARAVGLRCQNRVRQDKRTTPDGANRRYGHARRSGHRRSQCRPDALRLIEGADARAAHRQALDRCGRIPATTLGYPRGRCHERCMPRGPASRVIPAQQVPTQASDRARRLGYGLAQTIGQRAIVRRMRGEVQQLAADPQAMMYMPAVCKTVASTCQRLLVRRLITPFPA